MTPLGLGTTFILDASRHPDNGHMSKAVCPMGTDLVPLGLWERTHRLLTSPYGALAGTDEDGSRDRRLGIPGELVRDRTPAPRLQRAHDRARPRTRAEGTGRDRVRGR